MTGPASRLTATPGSSTSAPDPEVVVAEVRVHGVGGASPAEILNRTDIVPEQGTDRVAGFYGTTDKSGPRKIVAYSWGGLTSRKASRALWTLLLPFSFINVAGWMIEPANENVSDPEQTEVDGRLASKGLATVQRWLVHLFGIITTGTYVLWVALVSVNMVAYQCGAREECYERRAWLEYLGDFRDNVGQRIVVGALVPIGLLCLFLFLCRRSRTRYDRGTKGDEPQATSFGSSPPPLTDLRFWRQSEFIKCMARIHFGAVMALLAGCLGYTMVRFGRAFEQGDTESHGGWLMWGAAGLLIVALVAVAIMLAQPDPETRVRRFVARTPRFVRLDSRLVMTLALAESLARAQNIRMNHWVQKTTRTVFWGSWILIGAALIAAWPITASDARISADPAVSDLWGFAWLTFWLMATGVIILMAATVLQLFRWALDHKVSIGQFIVPGVFLLIALFPFGWMLAAVTIVAVSSNLGRGVRYYQHDTSRPHKGQVGLGLGGRVRTFLGTGWVPVLSFVSILVVGGSMGEVWLAQAALGALVTASYQLIASFDDYPMFRWFGTAAVGSVGLLGLVGVLAGITLRLEALLEGGRFDLQLPYVIQWMALSAFVATVVAWAAWLLYLVHVWLRWAPQWELEEKAKEASPVRSVVLRRVLVKAARSFDVLITVYAMLLFSAAASGVWYLAVRDRLPIRLWLDQGAEQYSFWVGMASWAEVAYVAAAYFAIRSALRDEGWRRRLGMIWDVVSFWPNRYHPFAPPAYAARAVPDLIDHISEDLPEDKDDNVSRATILSGHSQGSVLCFAAVAALDEETAQRVVLVSHGSPLGSFYRSYFPDVFREEVFQKVGRAPLSWINFYRETDPIGGSIGTQCPMDTSLADCLRGSLTGHHEEFPNAVLPDPCHGRAEIKSHFDYDSDPCMVTILDELTTLLMEPPATRQGDGTPASPAGELREPVVSSPPS